MTYFSFRYQYSSWQGLFKWKSISMWINYFMTSKHLQWNFKFCSLQITNIQSFYLWRKTKVNVIIILNRWRSSEENCKAKMKFSNGPPTACSQIVRNSLNNGWVEQTIKLFTYKVSIHIMNIAYNITHFWKEIVNKFNFRVWARGLVSASRCTLLCFPDKIIIRMTIIGMLIYKQS